MKKYVMLGVIIGVICRLIGISLGFTIATGIVMCALAFYIIEYKKLKGDIKNG